MLRSLAIRDIVLIDRLDLALAPGLSALTGETGAGKSIILDALGLALGNRGERSLVRTGAEQGSVTAEFEPEDPAAVERLLQENGIPFEGELILRRLLGADGRSRAFVNDTAVSTALLRQVGDLLVEVHGQFEQRGLLNPQAHRGILDAFGGHGSLAAEVRERHAAWREAKHRLDELRESLERARREEDYLRHRAAELADLAPQPGEEEELTARRQQLLNRDRLVTALGEALSSIAGNGGAAERLGAAERKLERTATMAPELLEPVVAALNRALVETSEAEALLEGALRSLEDGAGTLEEVEERLFALRDAARKHRVPVEALPDLLAETQTLLDGIDAGAGGVTAAEREVEAARAAYREAASALSKARAATAGRLTEAVLAELPPLKLERARIRVELDPLPEDEWGPDGAERVAFTVSTNPGQPFGPIGKIASGGELSRFMLAVKVVLARLASTGTLIFDEVDAGIGGATAAAVGERLARLGEERQVLVVTHAPQVAARARHQYSVSKSVANGKVRVEVRELTPAERRDEIARMLAGAEVTEAARAAAESLMRVAGKA